jgi:hypothetical protein
MDATDTKHHHPATQGRNRTRHHHPTHWQGKKMGNLYICPKTVRRHHTDRQTDNEGKPHMPPHALVLPGRFFLKPLHLVMD